MLTERKLARLRLELEQGGGLVFVRAERVSERRELLDWLEAQLGAVGLVQATAAGDPWGHIREAADRAAVVVVTGDELLRGEARQRWREGLNVGRDTVFDLPAPVLFLVDEQTLDELAQQAPDLWGRRGGVYEGEGWTLPSPKPPRAEKSRPSSNRAGDGVDPEEDTPARIRAIFRSLSNEPSRYVDLGDQGWGASLHRVKQWLHGEPQELIDELRLAGPQGVGARSLLWRLSQPVDRELLRVRLTELPTRLDEPVTLSFLLSLRDLLRGCQEHPDVAIEPLLERIEDLRSWLRWELSPGAREAVDQVWRGGLDQPNNWRLSLFIEELERVRDGLLSRVGAAWRQVAERCWDAGLRPLVIGAWTRQRGQSVHVYPCEGWKVLSSGAWVGTDGSLVSTEGYASRVEVLRPIDWRRHSELLASIVQVRMASGWPLTEDAIALLIAASGGLPGLLVKLVHGATARAALAQTFQGDFAGLWPQSGTVSVEHARRALDEARDGRTLTTEQVFGLRRFIAGAGEEVRDSLSVRRTQLLMADDHLIPNPTPGGPPILHPLTRYALTGELPE